ncbi:hypothetical protein FHR24_001645 [Wenyingzhuangia heitensis]|uniref:MerC mercury resistance protein n=1 Tax=Wenyingzhuangia heitensis TaxID=1487859 RepID=A0ABX0UCL1_9FLAO|nr:MerC domain-containing protein [Wenyingzhuangia heitensis]NIJ45206.1 hypothetical protein [Wenyingzhuangia heitensis]
MMILTKEKSDTLGALASSLCLIHCVATPFLFIAQTCATTCNGAVPHWWSFIDYIFLVISFFAVYKSTQETSISFIKPLLWFSWFVLFLIIANEKLELIILNEATIYIPALALIGLHLYNKKYCKCNVTKCCTNS